MRARWPILTLALLAACGGTAKTATPVTSTPHTVATTTTTIPAGVGPLCMAAIDKLATYTNHQLGSKTGATDLIDVTLNDCATRIEWMTAATARFTNPETMLNTLFDFDCSLDRAFGSTPTACERAA